jgi:DNA-binding beta-propeller fold protein YncE
MLNFGKIALIVATFLVPSAAMAQDDPAQILGDERLQSLMERTAPVDVADGSVMPHFIADPAWPKPLPNNWTFGQIAGVYADNDDNIWVLQRSRSLTTEEAGLLEAVGEDAEGAPVSALGHPRPFGPITDCCGPAPAVMQFDQEGNLLRAWGGPSDIDYLETMCRQEDGCFWPANEHGIYIDHNDFVYIGSNGNGSGDTPWASPNGWDGHVLKFTMDGEFVLQVGAPGSEAPDSNDTDGGINGTPQLFRPADMVVDPETNILYIADGYGNNRVVAVDAESGQYVGHFGAYGQNPVDDDLADNSGTFAEDLAAEDSPRPGFFRNPVHCVEISDDRFLYVCDRGNNRIQVFDLADLGQPCDNPDGEAGLCGFVEEQFVSVETRTTIPGTAVSVNFSTDDGQTCLYVGDNSNMTIYVLSRDSLGELARFGRPGQGAGEFHWLHNVAVDASGNIYTGEVDTGKRAQRFIRYGEAGCSGDGDTVGGVLMSAAE